jgi:capsular exopolysaccharide synthesis family protein
VELGKYLPIALKWWWLAVLSFVLPAGVSYLVSRALPPVYQATTVVIVGQSTQVVDLNNADVLTSEKLALTYADIAQRQPVLQGVVDTLHLQGTWRDLGEQVQVRPVRNTQLLEISAEAGSPQEAQRTADEFAHQLILLSPTALQGEEERDRQLVVRQRLETLQTRIQNGLARLAALEAEMTNTQSAERLQELQNDRSDLERVITDWETNDIELLSLREREAPNHLSIVQPAQADPDPVRPRHMLNILLAGVMGLCVGIGTILPLEYLDDTLKSPRDFSQSLNLTPLGTVNHFGNGPAKEHLVTSQPRFSAVSECYRMIRSNIHFAAVDQEVKTVLITSPGPGEGKSTTVANLGVVMAQAGLKTVILDADLRRPRQHEIFHLVNLSGLTDLLTSPEFEIQSYLQDTNVENLSVIPSGFLPPNPSEMLASQRMKYLLFSLSNLADVIILDSPPATTFADAVVLSNRVDGVVLITEAGKTRRDIAMEAISNLRQAGANVLGAVLNRVSQRNTNYKYYASYANYGRPRSEHMPPPDAQSRPKQRLPFFRFSR